MGSSKNQHRPSNAVKSTFRRKRKSAAKAAAVARWKKPTITGARVMDMRCLSRGIQKFTEHSSQCKCKGKCCVREVRRDGLASVLEIKCDSCSSATIIESSPKIAGSAEIQKRYSVNVGAVWGQMATGGGHRPLNEIMSAINVPGISKESFIKIENQIGASWETILAEEMLAAGREEKRLAMERNEIIDGYPAITVIVDGGWSKRSHKHSYNAKSGVAIIMGNETKKLLYMGIRNKFCSVCAIASSKGTPAKKHTCFKNWSGSSCSMETDILVDGFNSAEEMHGVRYMRVIGDGDSSVMCDIHQYVPVWGHMVKKIECANHAIKCYRNRLEKITQDFPKYKGKGKLTQRVIQRLTAGARCAIKMHKMSKNVAMLRSDLRNGPSHVFNDHANCNPSFCKVAAQVSENVNNTHVPVAGSQSNDTPSVQSTLENILNQEIEGENQLHLEEDEARGGDDSVKLNIPEDLLFRIHRAGDRLVSMAPQLIANATTNLAECYMNIRCKFDGGKFYNRVQRGSFQHRCYGAGLRFQIGPDWNSRTWQRATGSAPPEIMVNYDNTQEKTHHKSMERKSGQAYKEQRKKAK